MTTELILLVSIFAFLVVGAFLGDNGPRKTFEKSGPRLAARIEKEITVGHKFRYATDGQKAFETPPTPPPTGIPQ